MASESVKSRTETEHDSHQFAIHRRSNIVGATSQGSSGNPKPNDLQNGVVVFLPSWKDMLPDGSETEGVGIPPDIEVPATAADFKTADPVLEAALAHLRRTND